MIIKCIKKIKFFFFFRLILFLFRVNRQRSQGKCRWGSRNNFSSSCSPSSSSSYLIFIFPWTNLAALLLLLLLPLSCCCCCIYPAGVPVCRSTERRFLTLLTCYTMARTEEILSIRLFFPLFVIFFLCLPLSRKSPWTWRHIGHFHRHCNYKQSMANGQCQPEVCWRINASDLM